MIVRAAREDEREAIRALTLAAYAEFAAVMELAAWAGLDGAVRAALDTEGAGVERIVAERGGELVGSVMLYSPSVDAYGGAVKRASWPELRLLAVAPGARGAGVGQALVEECARRARLSGASELGLHTSESLRAAVRMYERMGFVRAPEFDFRPEGAELVMAYRLPLGD
ncbi:MAG: GNAT family N-acetyltransferase [Gemmatimonadetes bacterium]|nr:GNAT family N-acetyltransferase [Gemmatimonadota bacterium]